MCVCVAWEVIASALADKSANVCAQAALRMSNWIVMLGRGGCDCACGIV